MINTYVFEILETLSPVELDSFTRFLASPYFNNGFNAEKHVQLLQVYKNAKQLSDDSLLEREAVYRFVYGNEKFVDGKLDKLLTEFKKILKPFIIKPS